MMSRDGAVTIGRAMEEGKVDRGHVGIMLRNWLRAGGEAEKAKACYVYPSVGGVFRAPVRVRPEEFRRRQDQTSGVGEEECEQRHTVGGTTTTRGREANISSCGRATKSRRERERQRVDPLP